MDTELHDWAVSTREELGRAVERDLHQQGDSLPGVEGTEIQQSLPEDTQMTERMSAAERADQQLTGLEGQVEELRRISQQSDEQRRQASREVAGEKNRSMMSRLVRGGKARQAEENLEQATIQADHDRERLAQAHQEMDQAVAAQRQRPRDEQLGAVIEQEEHLSLLVVAVDDPDRVRAEVAWRDDASSEVLRVDQNRRQYNVMDMSLVDGVGSGREPWDDDELVRSVSRGVFREVDTDQQQSPEWGSELDGGREL